jgi:hypothetical protein
MIKHLLLLPAAALLITACGQHHPDSLVLDLDDVEAGELRISAETINEIIQNIASPIEVAAQINSLKVPYSAQLLADPEVLSISTSRFEIAYSLGALNFDLAYLNIYEKTGTAINFLTGINHLADALDMGQFFDLPTFKSLATSSTKLDSLMFMSVSTFNNMDTYLRETDRNDLSALMIAGVWMEGFYFSTQVARQYNNEELKSMIGDQKLILNDLLLILNNYKNETIIAGYITDLELIKDVFDEVKITYEVGEPQTIEKDGMLLVVQSESSHVSMSHDTLLRIIGITEQVRNKHMKINVLAP